MNTTATVKSSWSYLHEWILRSSVIKKFIKDNLVKLGKDNELFAMARAKEPQLHKTEYMHSLFAFIDKYTDQQYLLLRNLHKMRTDGSNILHILTKINAEDAGVYAIFTEKKYGTSDLWIQTDNKHRTPFHILLDHRTIDPAVFYTVYNQSLSSMTIQDEYGNTPIHKFFMKHSDMSIQSYIIDSIMNDKIDSKIIDIKNKKGLTFQEIYFKNTPWYLQDQQMLRYIKQNFMFPSLPKPSRKTPPLIYNPSIKKTIQSTENKSVQLQLPIESKRERSSSSKSPSFGSQEKTTKRTKYGGKTKQVQN